MPKKDDSPDFSFLNALSGGKDSAILTPETTNPSSENASNEAAEPQISESLVFETSETPESSNTAGEPVAEPVSEAENQLPDSDLSAESAEQAEEQEESGSDSIFDELHEEQVSEQTNSPEASPENSEEQSVSEESAEAETEASSSNLNSSDSNENESSTSAVEPEQTGFSWMNQPSAPATGGESSNSPQAEANSSEKTGFSWAAAETTPEKVSENANPSEEFTDSTDSASTNSPEAETGNTEVEKTEQASETSETIQESFPSSPVSEADANSLATLAGKSETEELASQAFSNSELAASAAAVAAATIGSSTIGSSLASSSQSSSSDVQTTSVQLAGAEPPRKGISQTVLISYASAITLFCLYLLMQSLAGKPHELESLPDLKPPMKKDGEIAYQLVIESAGLPNGHTLPLGKTQRFGNLNVTPLRVEKSPLEFTHYTGDANRKREPSEPVLKLWVKFENVSTDQKFAPIDRQLMLTKIVDNKRPEYLRSNQWISPARDKGKLDKTCLLYNLELFSDWNFAKMDDEPVLGPGESVEVYFPSAEVSTMDLESPLLWRVHFRKGYNPESYRGVTTLIEVKIDPKSIQST